MNSFYCEYTDDTSLITIIYILLGVRKVGANSEIFELPKISKRADNLD